MNDRDLMQQALDALGDAVLDYSMGKGAVARHTQAITALNERLAQPEQEPDPIGDAQDKLIAEMAAQPEQEPVHYGPSSSVFGLAEMILSDCGCSSDYQPLLNRVAARIMGYIDTPPAVLAAPVQPVASDGWLQSGGLLYRLTDGRKPQNWDEINVTMAEGSRSVESRTRRAGELLDRIRATPPAAQRKPLTSEQQKAIAETAKNGHASTHDAIIWAIEYTECHHCIKEKGQS
jgi:hypothetical protein